MRHPRDASVASLAYLPLPDELYILSCFFLGAASVSCTRLCASSAGTRADERSDGHDRPPAAETPTLASFPYLHRSVSVE